jgi:hypothetical protein
MYMYRTQKRLMAAIIAASLVFVVTNAEATANLLTNGDFETGNLNGWTVFTTANGYNGPGLPDVVQFNTCTPGVQSYSARFDVGRTVEPYPGPREGGGILQNVTLAAGNYVLEACTAVLDDRGSSNDDGGLFELLFDGRVVDSYDYGPVELGVTYRRLLSSLDSVAAGTHEVGIRITREWSSGTVSPWEYVDNVTLIPEPATICLLGLGALSLLRSRKRKT